MLSSLKESFRHLALVKQFLLSKGKFYKLIVSPVAGDNYILHEFIRKHNHHLKDNKQLAEELDILLSRMRNPLDIGKRN